MVAVDSKCGTAAGYQRHRKRGEQTCEPCRDAQAASVRQHRATRGTKRYRIAQRVRARALAELGRRHQAELDALIAEYQRAEGS